MEYTQAVVMLALITLVMLMIEINFTYYAQGFRFGFSSNRDPNVEHSPLALRIKRAYQNQIESIAYTVPVLAAAALIGLQTEWSALAALLIVVGRGAFAVSYYTGIHFARVPAFLVSLLSTFYLVYCLLV